MRKPTIIEIQSIAGELVQKEIERVNYVHDRIALYVSTNPDYAPQHLFDNLQKAEQYMDGSIMMAKALTNIAYKAVRINDGSGKLEMMID